MLDIRSCWRELRLPAKRTAWENAEVLDFFRGQQEKVVVFASRLHARMDIASCVSSLNELSLVMITDEVLGGWTLHRQWEREVSEENNDDVEVDAVEGVGGGEW